MHVPLEQTDKPIQPPGLIAQIVPSSRLPCTHTPEPALHASVVHALPSSQFLIGPVQPPLLQVSGLVHGLPSSQDPPLLMGVYTQAPDFASQVSVVHGLVSLQTVPMPVQTPVEHASLLVQTLPSLQTVPSVTGV